MRKNQTQAEEMLWAALRGRKLAGLKFQRQHVLGTLIVDFYCAEARQIVEVDGGIHDYQANYDATRTRQLEDHGYQVIRFKDEMVLNDLENVLSQIEIAAFGRISDLTPNPSPDTRRGETDLAPDLQRDCAASSPETRRGESDPTPDHHP